MAVLKHPVNHIRITSPYGMRYHPIKKRNTLHQGRDYASSIYRIDGDKILAAHNGIVRCSKLTNNGKGLGEYIVIENKSTGLCTLYGHLSRRILNVGAEVMAGDAIGLMGTTGDSTGTHLHFGVFKCKYSQFFKLDKAGLFKYAVDPSPYFSDAPVTKVEASSGDMRIKGMNRRIKKLIQEDLKIAGFYKGKIDGYFGGISKRATAMFQATHNLEVDGVPGPNTQAKLLEIVYGVTKYWKDKQTLIIKIPKRNKFNIELCKQPSEYASYVQKRVNGVIGHTGGMFGMKNGKTLTYLLIKGRLLCRGMYSKWALARMKDGTQKIRGMAYHEEHKNLHNFVHALGAAPSLVIDGVKNIDNTGLDSGFIYGRHPRLAIGYDDDYFYVVVVHGRRFWMAHKGCTINELANLMVELKVDGAINLDGGGSIGVIDRYGRVLNKLLGWRKVDNFVYYKPEV